MKHANSNRAQRIKRQTISNEEAESLIKIARDRLSLAGELCKSGLFDRQFAIESVEAAMKCFQSVRKAGITGFYLHDDDGNTSDVIDLAKSVRECGDTLRVLRAEQ